MNILHRLLPPLLSAILLCNILPLAADEPLTAPSATRDSMLALLPTLPHDSTRLELLENLSFAFQQTKQHESLTRQFIAEARLQGNLKKESSGLYLLMLCYFNNDDSPDSLAVWLERIHDIARQTGRWRRYFDGQELLISNHIYSHQYEYAIRLSREMAAMAREKEYVAGEVSAYYCMANAYNRTNRRDKEHEALQQAYALFPRLKYTDIKLDVLALMVEYDHKVQDWEQLKQHTDDLEGIIRQKIQVAIGKEAVFNNQLLYTEAYRIYYYTARGEYDTARQHIEHARRWINDDTYQRTIWLYQDACIEYLKGIGQYQQALALNDTIIHQLKAEASRSERMIKQLKHRGDLLQLLGRYREAAECYECSLAMQDSIQQVVSDKQVEELKKEHNIDQLLIRQATLREKTQQIVLVLSCSILLFSILYFRHINRVRRELHRARQQTKEATRQSEQANELKGIFLNNLRRKISQPIDTVVHLSQQLAENRYLDEPTRLIYAHTITDNTTQLIQLVNSVLDLSRLEADMTKWQISQCDLVQISLDAISAIRLRRPSTEIEFDCNLPSMKVQTDGKRMMQLIESCLSSSINPLCPHGDPVRHVRFTIRFESGMLHFRIWGSHLASKCDDCHEKNIRNDINRLTIKHFGGEYILGGETPEGAFLEFTYPVG